MTLLAVGFVTDGEPCPGTNRAGPTVRVPRKAVGKNYVFRDVACSIVAPVAPIAAPSAGPAKSIGYGEDDSSISSCGSSVGVSTAAMSVGVDSTTAPRRSDLATVIPATR